MIDFYCYVVLFCLQFHEEMCPFATVTCEYCNMELIRDQVSSYVCVCNKYNFIITFHDTDCNLLI